MRRIFGIETEYALSSRSATGKGLSGDEAARILFRPVSHEYGNTNVFLGNGGRLYLDVGAHPEYATAECDRLDDLLAQDRAGEAILAEMIADANQALADEGRDATLALFKNNTDSHGNSYGCHENYLVARHDDDFARFTAGLLPFLVTRQLICGAGTVHVADGQGRFELSQRAGHMLEAVASTTTRSRPMINTRDEPHADPRHFRRLHVIVGDSNLSEVTGWLKVGTTALALRVLEERGPEKVASLALADPGAAIVAAGRDPRGAARLCLDDGSTATALDVQRRYRDAAAGLGELSAEESRLLAMWSRVLDAVGAGDVEALAGEIDWAIKLSWLRRYAARHGIPEGPRGLADPRIAELNLAFHEVTGRGVFRLLEARGSVARLTRPADVEKAQTDPPATTRAVLRARLLDAARERGREFTVDWARFQCGDVEDGAVLLPDPFDVVDERVDRLVERMRTAPKTTVSFRFAGPEPV